MYELLAENYSDLFPQDDAKCGFIIKEAALSTAGKHSVLDIGCADGELAAALAECGIKVTAVDPDRKMIETAVKKYGQDPNLSFLTLGMENINTLGSFNAITCFGNTLPHLESKTDVLNFFRDSYSILEPEGRLIFQIINFDKIDTGREFKFPEINSKNHIFNRTYKSRSDGRIDFLIELENKHTGETAYDSTALIPLTDGELEKMLKEAGFSQIMKYPDYSGTPSDGSEFSTIYSAAE